MIAKTSTGGSFSGAMGYVSDEGEKEKKQKEHQARQGKAARLIGRANLVSEDASGIASEMAANAQGSRCKKPVWHTSLSWPPGEQVSVEQMQQAAAAYCGLMGADLSRHQVAVYQHLNRPHPHVHIIINRVPVDGGPALDTSHNYARNVRVCKQISEQLGFRAVAGQRHAAAVVDVATTPRQRVQQGLLQVLERAEVRTVEGLVRELENRGVEAIFKHDSGGLLVGASFRAGGQAFKGSQVGYKASVIRERLALKEEQQKQVKQEQEKEQWKALFAGYAVEKQKLEASRQGETSQKPQEQKQDKKNQQQQARKGPRHRL